MTVAAVQASSAVSSFYGETLGASERAQPHDIEVFTKKLMASSTSSPEHQVVNQLQEAQLVLMDGIRDTTLMKRLSPESALAAQTKLAGSVIGIDMVAKVAGSFSTAVNKLVSMQ